MNSQLINKPIKTVRIHANKPKQTIDGWGTSLCWWANAAGGWMMKGDSGKEKREELMQLIFSEEGLDFNIVRYNIGGGDNPSEKQHMFHYRGIPCYKTTPDNKFDPNADWRQLWVLTRAHEMRKGDIIHEVFVNSPPWWMTKSLCTSGNVKAIYENLDQDNYEEFIDYCTDVLNYLHNNLEVKVDYFAPMNEPASDYWSKGQRQEGCKFNSGESQTMLLTLAYEKLRQRKLDIQIAGTDETNPTEALNSYQMLGNYVKENILKKINYHHYAENDDVLRQLQQITYKDGFDNPQYKLWMDEVCYGDGNDDFELAKNLIMAIYRDLNIANSNAWLIWQAMDTMSENIINRCHWGLIEGMYQDKQNNELEGILDISAMGYDRGDYVITTMYYVMGHYSKYIKQGYTILENDGNEYYCVSAISPDKDIVIAVLYNDDAESKTISLIFDGYAVREGLKIVSSDERQWYITELDVNLLNIELESKSITTLKLMK